MSDKIQKWVKAHPEIENVFAGICDISGAWRGKRVPIGDIEKLLGGSMRMPLSIPGVDVWGEDPETSALVYKEGDKDGICKPTGRGVLLQSWTKPASAFLPISLYLESGEPFLGDPRQVLVDVVQRFTKKGLRVVSALEMEFYLFDPNTMPPRPPTNPHTDQHMGEANVLALDELEAFDGFFNDVYAACEAQGLSLDAAISENGAGQFEINFNHCDDPLRMADDAVLFKRIVKGTAKNYGLGATFMAKPYGDASGNGMHLHASLVDESGANIFDDGSDDGTEIMRHAVGGLLATMPEMCLIFAPHFNSYKRLTPRAHAPTQVAWGYDNRMTAVRIPGGSHKARRIEHRVAGADANPYLVMAAVLGGMLHGIENKIEPAQPIDGFPDDDTPSLPESWLDAINDFSKGENVEHILSQQIRTMILDMKEQERARFNAHISVFEYRAYL